MRRWMQEQDDSFVAKNRCKSMIRCVCQHFTLHRTEIYVALAYILCCALVVGLYVFYYVTTGVIELTPFFGENYGGDADMSGIGYVVYTNHCQIVDLSPYKREVMRHFNARARQPCQPNPPLTRINYDAHTQRYVLSIDPAAFPSYRARNDLNCCYRGVVRIHETAVNYTECETFGASVQLSNDLESIIVSCYMANKLIYINGHPTIPEKLAVRQRLDQWAAKDRGKRVPSVLMIGIDSISRLNLLRAMPKTAQYLYDNDWFELAGYNKVADNTFPNLMAVLVGYNNTTSYDICNPRLAGRLDKCDFIWKLFQQHGFVTAYGEDAIRINTFNYLKKGFQQPPVDYYLRPYLYAAERKLQMDVQNSLPHCVGYETEAEHVYNYAQEFARRYRNDSFFGFFWTNTHSHSDISQTSSMDDYLRGYLQRLVAQGTMENSIVVFFSDHGLRFGPTRSTWSGYLEERLPFLFIWLPEFVRQVHPEFVDALRVNRNRLTTPYDLHLTLKHILSLSGRAGSLESLGGAKDCPQCQSLLLPVPLERSCEDVAIADHWCTCRTYSKATGEILNQLANYVMNHINQFVASYANGRYGNSCEPLSLNRIRRAYVSVYNESIQIYMLTVSTHPNSGIYETTLRRDKRRPAQEQIVLSGGVSRVNSYAKATACEVDDVLIYYCHCRENKTTVHN